MLRHSAPQLFTFCKTSRHQSLVAVHSLLKSNNKMKKKNTPTIHIIHYIDVPAARIPSQHCSIGCLGQAGTTQVTELFCRTFPLDFTKGLCHYLSVDSNRQTGSTGGSTHGGHNCHSGWGRRRLSFFRGQGWRRTARHNRCWCFHHHQKDFQRLQELVFQIASALLGSKSSHPKLTQSYSTKCLS